LRLTPAPSTAVMSYFIFVSFHVVVSYVRLATFAHEASPLP
jgi:hypothetical protein